MCICAVCAKSLELCLTLCNAMAVAHQTPLSMRFSRQEYWSGLPCPPPGGLPDPGIEPTSLTSPALAGRFFITSPTWKTPRHHTQTWKHPEAWKGLLLFSLCFSSRISLCLPRQVFQYTPILKPTPGRTDWIILAMQDLFPGAGANLLWNTFLHGGGRKPNSVWKEWGGVMGFECMTNSVLQPLIGFSTHCLFFSHHIWLCCHSSREFLLSIYSMPDTDGCIFLRHESEYILI